MSFISLATILDVLNKSIDIFLLGALFVMVVFLNSRSLVMSAEKEIEKERKRVKQEEADKAVDTGKKTTTARDPLQNPGVWIAGIGKALYLWIISAVIQILVFLVFWFTPDIRVLNILISAETLRWVELYFLLGTISYFFTRKYGENRGRNSMLGHLTVLLIGWLLGRWFGIAFVSLPMLGIYYFLIYRFAEVIIPASDPEDRDEKWQRFKILAWYTWGKQFPIIIVADSTGMNVETRIKGDAFEDFFGVPGYIWAHMPQAIGITTGTNFSRVEGPGAIYTRPYERPLDVIDLRTQLRTSEVEAITQDGIRIKAIVFMSFGVDRESWNRSLYNHMKFANPMLQGGMSPDHGNSHFQYSRARVRATLGMEGVRSNILGPVGSLSLRWDEQVVELVGEAARRVISEIPLSELWLPNPQKDAKGVSALDLIADKIKDDKNPEGLFSTLQKDGVRLYAARVVNYFSPEDKQGEIDEFTRRQIPAWRAHWKRQVEHKLVEADAEAEQKQLDANALARSMLLTSVAQSLQKTSETNKELPRYLIAMRFLGALDDMIRQEPEFATAEKGKALRERIAFFEGNPPPSKG